MYEHLLLYTNVITCTCMLLCVHTCSLWKRAVCFEGNRCSKNLVLIIPIRLSLCVSPAVPTDIYTCILPLARVCIINIIIHTIYTCMLYTIYACMLYIPFTHVCFTYVQCHLHVYVDVHTYAPTFDVAFC